MGDVDIAALQQIQESAQLTLLILLILIIILSVILSRYLSRNIEKLDSQTPSTLDTTNTKPQKRTGNKPFKKSYFFELENRFQKLETDIQELKTKFEMKLLESQLDLPQDEQAWQ